MRISDLLKMGLRNLSRRKARTALTVIGVVIGTISIVVMVSIGIGMNASFKSQVMEQGDINTITVQKYSYSTDEKGNVTDSKEQVIDDTLLSQIKQLTHVKYATGVYSRDVQLYSGKYMGYGSVTAMDYEGFSYFNLPGLTLGTYPDVKGSDKLVFGNQVLMGFYNPRAMNSMMSTPITIDPAKDKITLSFDNGQYERNPKKKEKRIILKNIGTMEESNDWQYSYSICMDSDYFKKLYSEYITTLKVEGRKQAKKSLAAYDNIKVRVDNVKNVTKVQKQIKELGYGSDSLGSTLETMEQTSNMLQMVLGGVGAVAMLVSAISIANTMVMSIYERTKEIGVMKVLGCFITDIKKLFLFEAAMIGMIGGVIGIILSYIASYCINKFGAPLFKTLLSNSSMYDMANARFSIIPFWLPFLAAGFAIGVGIISGYYPAKRATKISAIEAMKTES
ncbi:ABC transporter permease [Anaeromicropila herbilytica]|uniref:ABC transporter permease n=1 Tax=Anaeromicropila herbilytica TaxID=2785025 RepID=A0A7R7EP62_9FIRM|nr:ABC transporter permease [Anaeromicropila herbilytica]BCN32439.1 ABC transporter permease [Anaeromicropila herbilytica]